MQIIFCIMPLFLVVRTTSDYNDSFGDISSLRQIWTTMLHLNTQNLLAQV